MRSRLPYTVALGLVLAACPACPQGSTPEDQLYRFLIQQNKAQLVMLTETGLLPRDLAERLARALRDVDHANQASGGKRSSNYLVLEEQLIARMGPEASKIHLGRSRNDLGATAERLVMRQDVLELLTLLGEARGRLVALAENNVETVIPGFTHAVQAQPTTLAHYLSAFVSSLERDEDRLREAYARINLSPLGAGAFTTSGFKLDRRRLQELMGFAGMVENSYDAIMVATVDSKAELASALAVAALNAGRFAQQFLIQYSDSRPGLNLADESVGGSSIMPQKRNPGQVERLRILASSVLGEAQSVMIAAHNTPGGEVADIRIHLLDRVHEAAREAKAMFRALGTVAGDIRVDPRRTLEIVEGDYSVMTELADALLREGGVPFRTGHKVASEVAAYGRARQKRPLELEFSEVAGIYRQVTGQPIPLSAAQVRQAMSALHFVRSRSGTGGPQPAEMERMLGNQRRRIESLSRWVAGERSRLAAAEERLEAEFSKLL